MMRTHDHLLILAIDCQLMMVNFFSAFGRKHLAFSYLAIANLVSC